VLRFHCGFSGKKLGQRVHLKNATVHVIPPRRLALGRHGVISAAGRLPFSSLPPSSPSPEDPPGKVEVATVMTHKYRGSQ
jgi:hypothetical protein